MSAVMGTYSMELLSTERERGEAPWARAEEDAMLAAAIAPAATSG